MRSMFITAILISVAAPVAHADDKADKGNAKEEKYPHEVGQKKANPFGLHDMHGNISEFCEDQYAEKLPGGTDPVVTDGDFLRVTRGGDWLNFAAECRSASRRGHIQSYRDHFLGFRVVRSSVR